MEVGPTPLAPEAYPKLLPHMSSASEAARLPGTSPRGLFRGQRKAPRRAVGHDAQGVDALGIQRLGLRGQPLQAEGQQLARGQVQHLKAAPRPTKCGTTRAKLMFTSSCRAELDRRGSHLQGSSAQAPGHHLRDQELAWPWRTPLVAPACVIVAIQERQGIQSSRRLKMRNKSKYQALEISIALKGVWHHQMAIFWLISTSRPS